MIGHLNTSTTIDTINNDSSIMCKNAIALCTKCADVTSNWSTCGDFIEFKKKAKVGTPETTEWIDTHGSGFEPKMKIDITLIICSKCAGLNKKRRSKKELYESVNSVVEKLAGVFTVKNSNGDLMMPVWTKQKHTVVTREIETDTETETESESESDSENENKTKSKTVAPIKVAFKTDN